MPQYSNTQTASPSGIVINADYNTETNTITYTATAPNGATASNTQDASLGGNRSTNVQGLWEQLTAGGFTGTRAGLATALSQAQVDVTDQQRNAAAAASATNTPVAAAPAPPVSTNSIVDPAVPAATPSIAQTNTSILKTIAPASDPAIDEFAGVDAQAAANIENPAAQTVTDAEVQQQLLVAQDETIENRAASKIDVVTNIEQQVAEEATLSDEIANRADSLNTLSGLTTAKTNTQSQATQQDSVNFAAKADWRVRLSLSPGASYLYKANPAGILAPLQATDGIIFPYTPDISVNYVANYDPTELTHSNYKFYTYRGSAVDTITIGCEFTAQDTAEANYVLAVIHFFRSITKMFYGQDQSPTNGTPPPLCYLSGLGAFQFDAHPLAITNFTYKLPTDVDYIQAGSTSTPAGVNRQNNPSQGKPGESPMAQAAATRLGTSGLNTGALSAPPSWQTANTGTKEPTYVPTKINLSITAVPIVTRNDISNNFSLQKYATGELLRGTKRSGGGIW